MRKRMKSRKRPLTTILLCNLFLTLTVTFFSPMEVVLANLQEFFFPFRNVWWFQLLIALGEALVLTIVMFLLPPRAGQIAAGLSLGLGLAAYIQAMFLNGHMVSLTGERMKLTDSVVNWNLVIWGLILAGTLLAVILCGHRWWKGTNNAVRFVAGALTVMQTVAFVGTVMTTDTSDRGMDHYLSTDGEFEMSAGTNVIEFAFDTVDGIYVHEMLEQFPEMKEILSGWVYYPNATSVYARTYPSIPYMLTGTDCRYDLPWDQYVDKAFAESSYLKRLHDTGTDVRVFSMDSHLVSNGAEEYIANSSSFRYNQFENLNLPKLEENLRKIGLYKSLPYQFKNSFSYSTVRINMSSFVKPELFYRDFSYMDPEFYAEVTGPDPLTRTEQYDRAFRFYHLFGTHPGVDWDENLQPLYLEELPDGEAPRGAALRGSFRILEAYMEQMKALGIYDQALIIVTTDHGIAGNSGLNGEENLEKVNPACPMIMVKYPGSDATRPLEVSRAPVSHADIFATVEKTLGVPVSGTGSGQSFDDFREDSQRDRYYYHAALRSDEEGEIALLEYRIDGDAEDFSNWHLTGQWWDILYSMNAVSGEEYP